METKLKSPETPVKESKRPSDEILAKFEDLQQNMQLMEKELVDQMNFIRTYMMKSFIPRYDFEHHIHNDCGECIADGNRNINYARDVKLSDKFEEVLFKQGTANTPIPTVPQPEIPKPEEDPNTITCKKAPWYNVCHEMGKANERYEMEKYKIAKAKGTLVRKKSVHPDMIEYPIVTYDSSDLRDVLRGEMQLASEDTLRQWKGVKDIGLTWELIDILQEIGQNKEVKLSHSEMYQKTHIQERFDKYLKKCHVEVGLGTRVKDKVMTFPEYVEHQIVRRLQEHFPFTRICAVGYLREPYNKNFHREYTHLQFLEFTIKTYNWTDVSYEDEMIERIRTNPPEWYKQYNPETFKELN